MDTIRSALSRFRQNRDRRFSLSEKLRIARNKRRRRSCPHFSSFPETQDDQVDAWLQSFRQLNKNRKPLLLARPRLECIPCFDNVLQHVSVKDAKNLREVHQNIEMVINRQQDRYFERLEVRLTRKSINLHFYNAFNQVNTLYFFCEKRENGCEITRNQERTISSELNFVDAALDQFKHTLERLHTKVGLFEIKCHRSPIACPNRKRLLSGLITVLHGFNQKLHVEKLKMIVNTGKDAESILNELKIGTLSEVEFEILTVGWGQIYKARNLRPHLPYLKELWVDNMEVNLRVNEFIKIPTVKARIQTKYNFKMLQRYIEKILLLPNFQQHLVSLRSMGGSKINLMTKLGANNIQTITTEYGCEAVVGTFPFPNQDGHVLELRIGNDLEFTRKLADPMQEDEEEEEEEEEEENEVEEEKVFTDIEKMTLSLNQNSIKLEIVKRLPGRKRTVLTFNKNDDEDEFGYLKKAFNAFGTHIQGEKLDRLTVKSVKNPIKDVDRDQLVSGLVKVLNRRKGNFHIEKIELKIQDAYEMKAVLNAIPSGMLKDIIVDFFSNQRENRTTETFGVEKHLPSLEELRIFSVPTAINLEQVAHLNTAYVYMSSGLSPEDLSSYRNKIQNNSSLQLHWIHFKCSKKWKITAFASALEPFTPLANNDQEPKEEILKGRIELSTGGTVEFELIVWRTNSYLKLCDTAVRHIVF